MKSSSNRIALKMESQRMKRNFRIATVVLSACRILTPDSAFAQQATGPGMMGTGMMTGSMMVACGVVGLLVVVFLVLGIAATLKYLRS